MGGGGGGGESYGPEYWAAIEEQQRAQYIANILAEQGKRDAALTQLNTAKNALDATSLGYDQMQAGRSAASGTIAQSNLAGKNALQAASDLATRQAQMKPAGGTGGVYDPAAAQQAAFSNIGAGTAMASQGGVAGPASALSGSNTAAITPNTGAPRAAAKFASLQQDEQNSSVAPVSKMTKFGGS
jgi:hypothetical protein